MYSLHFYANEWSHNEHVGCEWQWSDQYDKYREMAEKAGSDKYELFLLEFDKQKQSPVPYWLREAVNRKLEEKDMS